MTQPKKKLTKADILAASLSAVEASERAERNAWRDHFALRVMASLLIRPDTGAEDDVLARASYDLAEAMLTERTKRTEK